MASTNFENGTVITAAWLNDVNDAVYEYKDVSEKNTINPLAYPYFAKGDGITDDTTALNLALYDCSLYGKVLDGHFRSYKTSASVIVPTGVEAINGTVIMSDSNYLALAYNTNSSIRKWRVIGTGRTNQYPDSQRGIGEQISGSTNVTVEAYIEGCNSCLDANGTCDSTFYIVTKDASGAAGISEGYGSLLYESASRNKLFLTSLSSSRHALYISSGSSYNYCIVHSKGTKTQFAVQINSTKSQGMCLGNYINGTSYGDSGGVAIFMDSSSSDTGGAVTGNMIDAFSVHALETDDGLGGIANALPAYLLNFNNAGATPAASNKLRDCKAFGVYNSTTLGLSLIHI